MKTTTIVQAARDTADAIRKEGIRATGRRLKRAPGVVHNALGHLEGRCMMMPVWMLCEYLQANGWTVMAVKSS